MGEQVIVIGASARAAANSASRAGFATWCADLFADVDLAALGPAVRVPDYPNGLAAAIREAPPGPWIYTGGLENHPALIEQISAERPLYGVTAASLLRVRDPVALADVLTLAGIEHPRFALDARHAPIDGSWLVKIPTASGGRHVRIWNGESPLSAGRGCIWQERVAGRPCAAVYFAAGGRAMLWGVTEQLLGAGDAAPFAYAGSMGPLDVSRRTHEAFRRIGDVLATAFGLVGIFGVDAIIAGDDVWLIEVNPRYPASAEVLERAYDESAVALHVAACRDGRLPDGDPSRTSGRWGKRILYARRHLYVTHNLTEALVGRNEGRPWPEMADIPSAGTEILAGHPVTTVLASGASCRLARERLAAVCRELGTVVDSSGGQPDSRTTAHASPFSLPGFHRRPANSGSK